LTFFTSEGKKRKGSENWKWRKKESRKLKSTSEPNEPNSSNKKRKVSGANALTPLMKREIKTEEELWLKYVGEETL